MTYMGAKEAADRIRGVFFSDRSMRTDPEHAHQMRFVKEVAKELGADESPETVQHLITLLRENDIDLHAGHEFPKYATRKWDLTAKVVHDADEEQAWINEEQPEPVDEPRPARTIEAPVQDLSLDLRDKVPHMVTDMPNPPRPPHIPAEVTNRAAAQMAYDQANPGLDTTNREAAQGVGTFEDVQTGAEQAEVVDDEVHVEEVGDKDVSKSEEEKPRRPVGERKRPM